MTTQTQAGSPLTILVVDDEGHRVTAVSNFQDAVAESSRRTFHMAFVDLRLGTASGMDLIPLHSGDPRRQSPYTTTVSCV